MIKAIKFVVITAIVVTGLYYLNIRLSIFEKNYTREEVQKHFLQHEKEFFELVNHFASIIPEGKKQMITLGLSKKGRVRLTILPLDKPMTGEKNLYGGYNLDLNSPELESVLSDLNWVKQDVIELMNKLVNINCRWIRTTGFYGNPFEIFYKESGLGSFSYYIFKESLTDSLKVIHNKPLCEKGFGSRVVINYSSAL